MTEPYLDIETKLRPLAYLALTASDLWPGQGWNFVFGEASLRQRIGVWSIYRNGDPETDFQLCLRRTLSTASHETGHILGMAHCPGEGGRDAVGRRLQGQEGIRPRPARSPLRAVGLQLRPR